MRATDGPGNRSAGSSCTVFSVGLDTSPPTAALSAPASPTKASTLTFGVTFSEPVTGLTASDFARTGTATGCVVNAPTGSGAGYSVGVTGCSGGTVILQLKAGTVADLSSNAGPTSPATASTVTIDRTAPTTTAPLTALRSGASVSGTTIPILVSWSGADTGGATVAHYELSRSTDGGSTWSVISTSLTSPSYVTSTGTTGTRRFRVRAVDSVGNVGAWVNGPTFTPRLVQESSASLVWSGTWTKGTSSSYCGGYVRYHTIAGRSVSYTFSGRAVAFVSTLGPTRGAVKVYIDGTYVTTIDLSSASAVYKRLVYQRTWSTKSTHTIKLVVVGTSGRPRVDMDALAVLF